MTCHISYFHKFSETVSQVLMPNRYTHDMQILIGVDPTISEAQLVLYAIDYFVHL